MTTKEKRENYNLIPYQIDDTKTLEVTQIKDDVWLTQRQMAELFGVNKPAISKHLQNIFEEGELDKKVVVSILETPMKHGAIEGKTQTVHTNYYNLDAIISVGYRVNSKRGVMFRQWATKIIKERIKNEYAQQTIKKIDDKLDNTRKECAKLINRALKSKGVTHAQIGEELGINSKTVWSCINSVHSNSRVFQWIEDNIFSKKEKSFFLENLKSTYKFTDIEMDILDLFFSSGRILREYIFKNIIKIIQYDLYEDNQI